MSVTPFRPTFRRRILGATCVAALALALAGCASKSQLTTGSIPTLNKPLAAMNASELHSAAESVGRAYDRNPKDPAVGMQYASVLTMGGRADQALAVMQQVAIHNPNNRTVLAAYGKALAGVGQFDKALDAIKRAQTPDRPDWQLLSAEGAIHDQLGDPATARERYRKALDIQPNEPSVLSNLGMSYVLQGDLRTAETYLASAVRQPGADSRVRQNLALVVGLQGRFGEAEKIASAELSPDQAAANVSYLRAMLSQQNAWNKLKDNDKHNTN
ncbi:tetratricopeptide repeat protein [Hoeflea olei]|uniref:Pilus assembly protein TadD n=1 Tax=Hoeflea olei TaxID=1480615 RepID=A0A1C1YX55_9HYPH|nr:tetratricopeptide repeat protein [Hoeflea olei]OCW58078.1 pilus assembly protein TadD [Hoeflea olei]